MNFIELSMAKGDEIFSNSAYPICMAKIDKGFFPADFADTADFVADRNSFLRLTAQSAGVPP